VVAKTKIAQLHPQQYVEQAIVTVVKAATNFTVRKTVIKIMSPTTQKISIVSWL